MQIKKIFVIGAGQMGSGIAQAALTAGYDVTIRDMTDEIVLNGKEKIIKNLEKMASKGKLAAQAAEKAKAKL